IFPLIAIVSQIIALGFSVFYYFSIHIVITAIVGMSSATLLLVTVDAAFRFPKMAKFAAILTGIFYQIVIFFVFFALALIPFDKRQYCWIYCSNTQAEVLSPGFRWILFLLKYMLRSAYFIAKRQSTLIMINAPVGIRIIDAREEKY